MKKKLESRKCKKCHYRVTKLYRQSHRNHQRKWIPVAWYCVECDKIQDRIR